MRVFFSLRRAFDGYAHRLPHPSLQSVSVIAKSRGCSRRAAANQVPVDDEARRICIAGDHLHYDLYFYSRQSLRYIVYFLIDSRLLIWRPAKRN